MHVGQKSVQDGEVREGCSTQWKLTLGLERRERPNRYELESLTGSEAANGIIAHPERPREQTRFPNNQYYHGQLEIAMP